MPSVPRRLVDGVGVQGALELAVGVGPEVGVGADDVDGAGGYEGDEHVLVDGQVVFFVIVTV